MTRNESRESQERDRQLNNNDDDTVLHASQHFINKQRHTHTHTVKWNRQVAQTKRKLLSKRQ